MVRERAAIVAALAVAVAAAVLAHVGTATGAAACAPRSNIEVILDDSGSMRGFDFNKLRVAATKLLLEKDRNAKKTFGAVQFGSSASTVFAPGQPAQQLSGMETALDALIQGDDGATDYNDAFARAKTDNPNANARIFLTDGGHNEGAYAEGHKGGPRTDVIGFGSSTQGEDGQRLARIAAETAGKYFPQTDSSNLQAVMNEIDAIYHCLAPPKSFSDPVTSPNQLVNHAVPVSSRTRSIDLVLSWAGIGNAFDLVRASIVRGGRVVAKSGAGTVASDSRRKRRRPVKLRIKRKASATFVAIKISRIKKGRLKFRLRAKTLAAPTTLVTQVTQSRSR